jgi:hypothetical protein
MIKISDSKHVLEHVGSWRILLKKPFLVDDRKFPGPLVRVIRRDARDPID